MTKALGILRGKFGRVALLDMDTSLVPHAHHHCHIILKASGPDQIFTVDQQGFEVREDTIILVNTWEQHYYLHRRHDVRTVFLALYIEPSWLKSVDGAFAACESPAFFARPGVAITDEMRRLRCELVHRIERAGYDDPRDVEELILKLTTAIVHQFADWRTPHRNAPGVGDFRIRRAIRLMRESMAEPVDFNGIARAAGLSRPHFNYLFRQCTGVTPGLFRNAIRIEASVLALSEADQHLAALSKHLGFSAQGNFTRFFQQHTGIMPSQFRRVLAELS